ncbi:sensor histidine kinase [Neobacillus drentensis]|uniref:sensor histidine kinase n=1 Tax=Neobacillus drentensis TaxID=220684 RepID=UPI002FFFEB6D
MFNQVKAKLTMLYSLSLLCVLFSFIGLLYFLISDEIIEKEIDEIKVYYNKEKSDFIEDLHDRKHHSLEYEPNRAIFYYVFNPQGKLIFGEESLPTLDSWLVKNPKIDGQSFIERVEWKQYHLLLVKKPLTLNRNIYGYVILGMNITSEKHLIQSITWTLIGLTFLFSLLFAGLGYYFAGQAMKPIRNAFFKQEKFVSDASHELRTPLSIFYSSVDLLLREEKDKLSDYGIEVLDDVKTEANLMRSLINNLLLLARSDKNQLPIERKDVNLSRLLMAIYKKFSRIASKSIHFEQRIQSGVTLSCDEVKVQQLIYILLDNAFRYTKEGKVVLSLQSKNGITTITLQDTGCGIPSKDLPFIFDRFYRADLSREKGGAGLGLSIAQTIVTAHGGEIHANSIEGEGTTLTIIFKE